MPAREVDRELVGVDAASFRKHLIGILEEDLTEAAVGRLLRQRTEVNPLLSNPYSANPLVSPMGRLDYPALARALVPVAPLPPGVTIIFDTDILDADA